MNKSATPLVSIIVPIYNIEDYLPKCINSLLAQTYKNIEIILIDDGSVDDSGDVCDKAALRDARVKVVHKNNGGLSDARNVGLKSSKGSLICFVDGDDYVSKYYVSRLYRVMKRTGADIVVCGFYRVSEKVLLKVLTVPTSLDGLGAIRKMLVSDNEGEVVAWNKLYRKQIFLDNNILYPKGKICEDVFTTYKLYNKSEKVVFIEDPLYFYISRDTSITGVEFSRKHLDGIKGTDQIILWAQKNYPYLLESAYASRARMTIYLCGKIYKLAKPDTEVLDSFTYWIRANREVIFFNKFIPFRYKLSLLLLSLGGNIYLEARKAYEGLLK